jgi:hypothetical protein
MLDDSDIAAIDEEIEFILNNPTPLYLVLHQGIREQAEVGLARYQYATERHLDQASQLRFKRYYHDRLIYRITERMSNAPCSIDFWTRLRDEAKSVMSGPLYDKTSQ